MRERAFPSLLRSRFATCHTHGMLAGVTPIASDPSPTGACGNQRRRRALCTS